MKLDFGAGNQTKEGFLGVDKTPGPNIQYVIDFDKPNLTLPFIKDEVEEIYTSHTLEHIRNIFPLINEFYRILMPGGKLEIIVPLAPSRSAFEDPTHIRFFGEKTFHYFCPDFPGRYVNADLNGNWKILEETYTPMYEEDENRVYFNKRRELRVIMTTDKELPKV